MGVSNNRNSSSNNSRARAETAAGEAASTPQTALVRAARKLCRSAAAAAARVPARTTQRRAAGTAAAAAAVTTPRTPPCRPTKTRPPSPAWPTPGSTRRRRVLTECCNSPIPCRMVRLIFRSPFLRAALTFGGVANSRFESQAIFESWSTLRPDNNTHVNLAN